MILSKTNIFVTSLFLSFSFVTTNYNCLAQSKIPDLASEKESIVDYSSTQIALLDELTVIAKSIDAPILSYNKTKSLIAIAKGALS